MDQLIKKPEQKLHVHDVSVPRSEWKRQCISFLFPFHILVNQNLKCYDFQKFCNFFLFLFFFSRDHLSRLRLLCCSVCKFGHQLVTAVLNTCEDVESSMFRDAMNSHQSVRHTPGLPGQTAAQPKGAVVYRCVCVPPLSEAAVLLLSQTPFAPQSALPVICRVRRVRERVKTQQAVPREKLTPAEQDAHSAQVVCLPPCSLTHVDETHTHTHIH